MKTAARTAGYVIKVSTKDDFSDNDGYAFAIFTKDEAKFGNEGYPEWLADSFEECLDWVKGSEERRWHVTASPDYKEKAQKWEARQCN